MVCVTISSEKVAVFLYGKDVKGCDSVLWQVWEP